MLRVHTDVFMKVYCYSINSVTTMVVTGAEVDGVDDVGDIESSEGDDSEGSGDSAGEESSEGGEEGSGDEDSNEEEEDDAA